MKFQEEREDDMAKIMTIRCNGPGKHINEVDIEKLTTPVMVVRGAPCESLVERYVLPCQYCTGGKVIGTRKMIEEM